MNHFILYQVTTNTHATSLFMNGYKYVNHTHIVWFVSKELLLYKKCYTQYEIDK